MRREIREKNRTSNKARMVAGYCWDWNSKKDPAAYDVVLPEHGFAMKWNLTKDGGLWMVAPDSVNEIGCIHTCQGLEVEYIGVVVGPDLAIEDGGVVTRPLNRSRQDKSMSGYKRLRKESPEEANRKADLIIRNTYRTLMTRGMKGCFVYFTDKQVELYFRSKVGQTMNEVTLDKVAEPHVPYDTSHGDHESK
jgi:DUF2075 family protein